MRELFITFLLFGLAVLLASTRFKQGSPPPVTKRNVLTDGHSTTALQSPAENTPELQPVTENAGQSVVENTTSPMPEIVPAQSASLVAPFLELEPEVTPPLATSLSLQEAIHPGTINTDAVLDLETNTSTIVEAIDNSDTQKAKDRDYQNVLEEVADLGDRATAAG